MKLNGKKIKLFTGNAHPELSKKIAEILNLELGNAEVKTFSDGEISVNINESVRGMDVFIINPTNHPVNSNLMELLIMIDAMKRASARSITAVMPYYGYARQDRKTKARDPITAKLVADIVTAAGANRVLTMDLHASQIQGYFNIPLDNLHGIPLLAEEYMKRGLNNSSDIVVVSPDLGSVTRARSLADKLGLEIAIIDKRRPKANVSEVMNVIGDVKSKTCILADDMIDTAGTITNGANALIERGATKVYACCTHGVLSGKALERIENSSIEELLIIDTIPPKESNVCKKIKYVSVAALFAEGIRRIFSDEPISVIF